LCYGKGSITSNSSSKAHFVASCRPLQLLVEQGYSYPVGYRPLHQAVNIPWRAHRHASPIRLTPLKPVDSHAALTTWAQQTAGPLPLADARLSAIPYPKLSCSCRFDHVAFQGLPYHGASADLALLKVDNTQPTMLRKGRGQLAGDRQLRAREIYKAGQ
jgi:hypothetical protein